MKKLNYAWFVNTRKYRSRAVLGCLYWHSDTWPRDADNVHMFIASRAHFWGSILCLPKALPPSFPHSPLPFQSDVNLERVFLSFFFFFLIVVTQRTKSTICLSHFELLWQNTIDKVASTGNTDFSQFRSLKVQDQGADSSGVWWDPFWISDLQIVR